ncbi:MAG TPA: hypothetical protein VLM80_08685 [Anaerolineales bacterium]|nr:hypothetical protein [Anaerolineales bacterium]
MAGNKSKSPNKREMRNLRIQQFIFIAIGVMVILSMIISLVAN